MRPGSAMKRRSNLGRPFVLGVNYWPRRKAMYWWSDFDLGEVREEFSLIRELGLTLVRVFTLWEDFQAEPSRVDPAALANLELVCDLAAELGLGLDVTFFTGHMSGPNWVPGWMLQPAALGEPPVYPSPWVRQVVSGGRAVAQGYRNLFSDPLSLKAAELLLRKVVGRLRGHPGVALWNLGNEVDLFAWPPDGASGREWVRRMAGIVRELDPDCPVTCGLHIASLLQDNGLRVNEVFGELDLAVMHGYPMYTEWARGPLDPDLVPYLAALTAALSGKPTLMEEFGGCTAGPGEASTYWRWRSYHGQERRQFMASEEALAEHLETVLTGLVAVGALGAVVWCFADYAPELWDRPPCDLSRHERFFGLVRPDGSLKPHAEVLRRFAGSRPLVRPASRRAALDLSAEGYYQDPYGHAVRLYQRFRGGD